MPRRVDPVRISHTVKKNMLKENGAMYENKDDALGLGNDVNLVSKDMEINFSNKQDEEDDLDSRLTPSEITGGAGAVGSDKGGLSKADTIDFIEEADLSGPVAGVPEEIKMVEKIKILEEQKEGGGVKKQISLKQTPGRGGKL